MSAGGYMPSPAQAGYTGPEPALRGCRVCTMPRAAAGFSLVELMLAMSLGLIVMAGLVRLFVGSKQTYALLHDQARLQESGRYALAFMGRSARGAGYLGCNARPERFVNTLNGALAGLFELNLGRALDAFDSGAGASLEAFAHAAGIDPGQVVAGTDIVAFRRVEAPLHRVVAPVESGDSPVVEVGREFNLEADDFVLVGDCEQTSLFRITQVIPGAGQATLRHDTGAGAYENSAAKTLTGAGKQYGPAGRAGAATVGRVLTETYFIAPGRGVNRRGERSRSLWRRAGTGTPAELVEGILDLQVSFGVDTQPADGIDRGSRHVRPRDVPPGGVIRAVHVLVTAGEPEAPRVFGQTFGLRNYE